MPPLGGKANFRLEFARGKPYHQGVNEIIFMVEEAPEGGFTARALGSSIFTEADTVEQLQQNLRDAVRCHFDEGKEPKVIRLHFVRDQVLAL